MTTEKDLQTIRYIADVDTPEDKAGTVGDKKERPAATAAWLIDNGYAEPSAEDKTSTADPAETTTPENDATTDQDN